MVVQKQAIYWSMSVRFGNLTYFFQFDRRRRANRLDREQPSQQVGYRALTYSRRCMNGTIVWNVQLVAVVNDNVDF